MTESLFIGGVWSAGHGEEFTSTNPANGQELWRGRAANAGDVDSAVMAANSAFEWWSLLSFEERLEYVEAFRAAVEAKRPELEQLLAQETGKPLWDCQGEAGAVIAKIAISVQAYHERTVSKWENKGDMHQMLTHRPLGVMAVFGPYNFPAHLPNGHMIPALLAGNTVVLKPSEETPAVAEWMFRRWEESGLPEGVVNLVQGARETGVALAAHPRRAGILFTGSYATGKKIHESLAGQPEIMLALEMGGNNPLVVHEVGDIDAAVQLIVQSAYISSGQRCTCARRLIVPDGEAGNQLLDALIAYLPRIRVGAYDEQPEPFMGPLINLQQAGQVMAKQQQLETEGAKVLVPCRQLKENTPFVSPGLIDLTPMTDWPDEECFGPLLQVIRVGDFEAALHEANHTSYGLAAGLLTDNPQLWELFKTRVRAGIVNWNRPLTGAASAMPFGGPGRSGNLRPSAYYAADYCAYPMATLASEHVAPQDGIVGIDD